MEFEDDKEEKEEENKRLFSDIEGKDGSTSTLVELKDMEFEDDKEENEEENKRLFEGEDGATSKVELKDLEFEENDKEEEEDEIKRLCDTYYYPSLFTAFLCFGLSFVYPAVKGGGAWFSIIAVVCFLPIPPVLVLLWKI